MINVAVVGYGMAAQTFHLPLLMANADFMLTAIVSRQTDADLSRYPQAKQYPDVASMLAQAAVDLVVITTPNDLHYSQALQCLLADKHVVIEKPMVLNMAEGLDLQDVARQRQRVLSVFHNRRWDSDFLTLRDLLAQGRMGKVRLFETHWDRFRPQYRHRWRENAGAGGGIWYDLAPHLLDQSLQLFGAPLAVSARLRALRTGSPAVDYAHVQLHYPEHEVILHTSPFQNAPNPRYVLQGESATYVKYGFDPQEAQLKAGLSPRAAAYGVEAVENHGLLYLADGTTERIASQRGDFPAFYQNIAQAIKGTAPLAVKVEEVLQSTALLNLAIQSDIQQKTLPFLS